MILPKVLIIGQTFNKNSGGGITMSNLFSGWDKDKIAVTCPPHLLKDSDNNICNNYYQLGEKEHKWIFPFNFLQKKFPSGVLTFDSATANSNIKHSTKSFRSKIVDDLFYPFLKYTGLYHIFSKIEFSPEFCNWINDFNPDVIYSQGQDRNRILFSLAVQSYLKKPIIYHMMDDWPSLLKDKGLFKNYWYKKIDKEFKILLDKSSLLMGISHDMAAEYKMRYNKNFITFHNPINIDFWKKYQKSGYELNDTPTILYAGRVGLGINASLETVAKAINLINEELDISMKFILQTSEKPLWANNYLCVEHKDFVPYNDLPKTFSEADFLILPYDFSAQSIKFIKYSMPTKAPEYMMSGTPILIFSPPETAIVSYAKKDKWAEVVTRNDVTELSGIMKKLIQSKLLRQTLGENAKKVAEEKYNADIVSKEFKTLICSVAFN